MDGQNVLFNTYTSINYWKILHILWRQFSTPVSFVTSPHSSGIGVHALSLKTPARSCFSLFLRRVRFTEKTKDFISKVNGAASTLAEHWCRPHASVTRSNLEWDKQRRGLNWNSEVGKCNEGTRFYVFRDLRGLCLSLRGGYSAFPTSIFFWFWCFCVRENHQYLAHTNLKWACIKKP